MNSTVEKKNYTKEELLNLYNLPLDELLKESSKYMSNNIEFCSLINARNGKCSQNCKYCAQSSHYCTNIESYPLVDIEEVKKLQKKQKQIKFHVSRLLQAERLLMKAEISKLNSI